MQEIIMVYHEIDIGNGYFIYEIIVVFLRLVSTLLKSYLNLQLIKLLGTKLLGNTFIFIFFILIFYFNEDTKISKCT